MGYNIGDRPKITRSDSVSLPDEVSAVYAYHVGNSLQWVDASLNPLVLNASNAEITGQYTNQ